MLVLQNWQGRVTPKVTPILRGLDSKKTLLTQSSLACLSPIIQHASQRGGQGRGYVGLLAMWVPSLK